MKDAITWRFSADVSWLVLAAKFLALLFKYKNQSINARISILFNKAIVWDSYGVKNSCFPTALFLWFKIIIIDATREIIYKIQPTNCPSMIVNCSFVLSCSLIYTPTD